MSVFRFDAVEFRERARERLLNEPPIHHGRSDDDLNPGIEAISPDAPQRPAAVLVPIVVREPELAVLFTQRTEHLPSHAGQIAFPAARSTGGTRMRFSQRCARPRRRPGLSVPSSSRSAFSTAI